VDPVTGVREREPKKRKRPSQDQPVIVKGKRSVKSPFTDYVEAPMSRRSFGYYKPDPSELPSATNGSEPIEGGEGDSESKDDILEYDGIEPNSGMSYLELVVEAVRVLTGQGQNSGITKIRQTILELHPEVLRDVNSHARPIAKTQLMNSVRAACWEAVTKRVLENKMGNSYKLVGPGRRTSVLATADGAGPEVSDGDDDGDSDDYSDTVPKKTYSHVTLEAAAVGE
jgi:hypothetical protein